MFVREHPSEIAMQSADISYQFSMFVGSWYLA
jgi:hypothetical protein